MKLADTPEDNAKRFLQAADAAGISKMVVHDVGADHLSDPAPADLTRINDLLLRVCAVSPNRFIPFATSTRVARTNHCASWTAA